MLSPAIIAACLLPIVLAACAGQPAPSEARPAPAQASTPRSAGSHAPVAPLQRQPAPARVPYQLILPPPLPAPPPAPVGPQAPLPLTTCDPGGCWNTGGSRYDGGIGDSLLDRNGRLCQRNGAWVQCF